jgi:hypothetical protein
MMDDFSLHPYICLTILNILKESLEDLEQSEIRATLLKLPPIDIEQVISRALNLKEEVRELGLVASDYI